MQESYADLTVKKDKKCQYENVLAAQAAYKRGDLNAPCVKLRCLEYNQDLFKELVSGIEESGPSHAPAKTSKRKRRLRSPELLASDGYDSDQCSALTELDNSDDDDDDGDDPGCASEPSSKRQRT